jgi:hypothetical protein
VRIEAVGSAGRLFGDDASGRFDRNFFVGYCAGVVVTGATAESHGDVGINLQRD